MARTLNEVMKSLPMPRRANVEAHAAGLIAEEASLKDLSKTHEGEPLLAVTTSIGCVNIVA